MSETIYHVLAHNDDDRDEKLVGTTPSYPEAVEWAEQARMDGWQHVRVDAVADLGRPLRDPTAGRRRGGTAALTHLRPG
jgi:hypothetical protein